MKQLIVLCLEGDQRENYTETDFTAAEVLFEKLIKRPGVMGFKVRGESSERTRTFDPKADEHRIIGMLMGG